uniref:Uncharacterized protein n=1 Tax=viral metagenome TaxID=1070528 RepID=A0A6M3IR12_9ZZZZ
MGTTRYQDDVIKEWLANSIDLRLDYTDLVDDVIADNFEPGDVFPNKTLRTWAKEYCEPEDIFSSSDLSEWAVNNGFVEEEEQ